MLHNLHILFILYIFEEGLKEEKDLGNIEGILKSLVQLNVKLYEEKIPDKLNVRREMGVIY